MFGLLVIAASVTLTKISGFRKDALTTRPMLGPNRSERCQALPGGINVPGHTDTSPTPQTGPWSWSLATLQASEVGCAAECAADHGPSGPSRKI